MGLIKMRFLEVNIKKSVAELLIFLSFGKISVE